MLAEVLSAPKGYVSPVTLGTVKMLLGQEEEGFSLLRKGLETHDNSLFGFGFAPQERKYVSDPRWIEIENKLGLPPSSKFPDFKH